MAEKKYIVGPETSRMLELGHPWVIADRYTKKWPKGSSGELVRLCSEQGEFLATALLSPGEKIVARVLSRESMLLDKKWLQARIEAALQLRQHAELDMPVR